MVALLAACSAADRTAGTTSTTVTSAACEPARGIRVTICDVDLDRADQLGIGLHPNAEPVVVGASVPQLSVCPPTGTNLGAFPNMTSCQPIPRGGTVRLPSTRTNAMHVGFAVRGTAVGATVSVGYTTVDRYFGVIPPAGDVDGVTVVFVPTEPCVAVAALGGDGGLAPNVRAVVEQRGRKIAPMATPCTTGETITGTRVTPGIPVVVSPTDAAPGTPLLVEWR